MIIENVPINLIVIRKNWNIRTENLDEVGAVNTLKTSIEEIGLQNPLQLNKDYELISGFRRYRACKLLRLETIPCNINLEFKNPLYEKLMNLDENLERKSLSDFDTERALSEKKSIYSELYPPENFVGRSKKENEHKSFAKDTADKTGLTPSNINRMVRRVDEVTPEVRQSYESQKISSGQVDEIVKLNKEDQNKVLKKIEGASVAETRLIVEDVKESKIKAKPAKLIDEDEKLLGAIFEVEKIMKSIKQTDIFIEQFFISQKFLCLDEQYTNRFRQHIQLLLSTIDRRLSIESFFEKEV